MASSTRSLGKPISTRLLTAAVSSALRGIGAAGPAAEAVAVFGVAEEAAVVFDGAPTDAEAGAEAAADGVAALGAGVTFYLTS